MDEIIIRVTEDKSGLSKIMVHADNIIIWEPNVSTLDKKFHRVVTVCEDLD